MYVYDVKWSLSTMYLYVTIFHGILWYWFLIISVQVNALIKEMLCESCLRQIDMNSNDDQNWMDSIDLQFY